MFIFCQYKQRKTNIQKIDRAHRYKVWRFLLNLKHFKMNKLALTLLAVVFMAAIWTTEASHRGGNNGQTQQVQAIRDSAKDVRREAKAIKKKACRIKRLANNLATAMSAAATT